MKAAAKLAFLIFQSFSWYCDLCNSLFICLKTCIYINQFLLLSFQIWHHAENHLLALIFVLKYYVQYSCLYTCIPRVNMCALLWICLYFLYLYILNLYVLLYFFVSYSTPIQQTSCCVCRCLSLFVFVFVCLYLYVYLSVCVLVFVFVSCVGGSSDACLCHL